MEIWVVTYLIEEDRPLSLEFFLPPFLLTWGEMSYVDKTFFDVGAGTLLYSIFLGSVQPSTQFSTTYFSPASPIPYLIRS